MPTMTAIENSLKETLGGERLKNALDLVAHMGRLGMTVEEGRFYYKGEMMSIFIYFKNDKNPEGELYICDGPLTGHEDFPVGGAVEAYVRASVKTCTDCGCDHPERGKTKTVFGQEYENLCSSEVMFANPDANAVEKLMKLMDLWVYKIDHVTGYSSQER